MKITAIIASIITSLTWSSTSFAVSEKEWNSVNGTRLQAIVVDGTGSKNFDLRLNANGELMAYATWGSVMGFATWVVHADDNVYYYKPTSKQADDQISDALRDEVTRKIKSSLSSLRVAKADEAVYLDAALARLKWEQKEAYAGGFRSQMIFDFGQNP